MSISCHMTGPSMLGIFDFAYDLPCLLSYPSLCFVVNQRYINHLSFFFVFGGQYLEILIEFQKVSKFLQHCHQIENAHVHQSFLYLTTWLSTASLIFTLRGVGSFTAMVFKITLFFSDMWCAFVVKRNQHNYLQFLLGVALTISPEKIR